MRILHVNTINQVANYHARALADLGYVSTIYQPSVVGGHARLPIKLALIPWRVLDWRHIVGKLNQNYFDLVHIHWASYGVLGLASRVPFVVQCHGTDVRDRLKHPLFRLALARVFRRAAAVLCTTPDLLSVVRTVYDGAIYLPAPIDTAHFAPPENTTPHPWTIFLFSRLEPGKRVEIAARGIEQFVMRHPDVQVQVVDWGELSAEYQRSYGQRFHFVPRVAPDAVRELLWRADVVVGQFGIGALTLSELQAMSCAKPVIMPFHREYESVYSAPPPVCQASTPDEVDAQLERLYQRQEDVQTIGQRGRDWVIAHHGCRVVAKRLDLLYRAVLR